MLLRIAALVLKNDGDEKLRLLANLKELLGSKDFKVLFAISAHIMSLTYHLMSLHFKTV